MRQQKYHRAPLALAISSTLAVSATQAAVITVDTLADPGAPTECSLRSAIEAVNTQGPVAGCPAGDGSNDEIVFDSTVTGNLQLKDGVLNVSSDVIITGPGSTELSIDGLGASGLFSIAETGVSAELSGLTLTNGFAEFGAAIYLSGEGTELSLRDCVISGNEAANNGGGIEVFTGARLLVDSCDFSDNIAADNGGGLAVTEGYARVQNSYFLTNTAALGGGAQVNLFRELEPPLGEEPTDVAAKLSIVDSRFVGNSATYGGGIGAGYFENPEGPLSLAMPRPVPASTGRGIAGLTNLEVVNSAVTLNDAYVGGGVAAIPTLAPVTPTGGPPEPDPGLRNRALIQDSYVYENSATFGGGLAAVYSGVVVYGAQISLNQAGYSGGGIFSSETLAPFDPSPPLVETPYLFVESSAITGNEVLDLPLRGRGSPAVDALASGGGLTLFETNSYLVASSLDGNTAPIQGGGAFVQTGQFLALYSVIDQNNGGGLYGEAAVLAVGESRITRNQGGLDGGAAGFQCEAGSECEIKYSEVSDNSGATVGGIGIDLRGGIEPARLDVLNVTVSGNQGEAVGGLRADRLTLRHSTVAFNSVLVPPRGVSLPSTGGVLTTDQAIVANSIVSDNLNDSGDSDIQLTSGTLLMDYSLVGQSAGLTFTGFGNVLDADPLLAALDLNGGPDSNGRTHALGDGSPALDAGLATTPPSSDQRGDGFDRRSGAGIDMGAFERQVGPPPDPIFSDRFELE